MDNKEIEQKMKELEAREARITELNKERNRVFRENQEVLRKTRKLEIEQERREERYRLLKNGIWFGVLMLAVLTIFIAGVAIGRNLWFLESVGF